MCPTSINVWFLCKLCRDSFRHIDAFIEHKKEKHFTQFQKTSCIVFEEKDYEVFPDIIKTENQPRDENIERPIKIEASGNNDPSSIPGSSEIMDEPNLVLFEPKSELITYESEINPESENNFFGLKQPEQNPYVLLKRLTPDEIQRACIPKHLSTLLKYERKTSANSAEPPNSEATETQSTSTILNIFAEHNVQFECKLCLEQLESDAQLRIHVEICALYHEDRNRYCVTCNQIFRQQWSLKRHCLTQHGTEEEKASLYKFKCQLCPKQYRKAMDLRYHLESHKEEKQLLNISLSPLKYLKCSQPTCGKEFKCKGELRRHAATHFDLRPFSCSNCNKTFTQRYHLKSHLRIHTGERPYKCTVDNCNKTFTRSDLRSSHRRTVHRNSLLNLT